MSVPLQGISAPVRASSGSHPDMLERAPSSCSDNGNSRLEACLLHFLQACADDQLDAVHSTLFELRRHLLLHGVHAKAEKRSSACMSIRGLVWKALLGVDKVDASHYLELVKRGPSAQYEKVRSDSFRTFPKDKQFQALVPENAIIRLLNTFVHDNFEEKRFRYLQGMNAVAGPFLYCMGELDAYFAFSKFIKIYCPMYWVPQMFGARAGCHLIDRCLKIVDEELFIYLRKRNLFATLYAFALVSSLSCCLQPFSEVLKLWDFLIAFGPHLNIVCVVAQVILVRDQIFGVSNPIQILNYRKWPSLDAGLTIALTMELLPQLPKELYRQIQLHPHQRAACDTILENAVLH